MANRGRNTIQRQYFLRHRLFSLITDGNGVITATVAGISSSVIGKLVTMTPLVSPGTPADVTSDMGRGICGWTCGGTGTTVDKGSLPSSCRG